MNRSPLILATLISLHGCSFIPDLHQPEMPVEDAYLLQRADQEQPDLAWETFFSDPATRALIEIALANNRDLRMAALNVRAYQEKYRMTRSDLFPKFDVVGLESRRRIPAGTTGGNSGSGNSSTGGSSGSGGSYRGPGSSGDSATINTWYQNTMDVSWEIDFFGQLESLRQESLEHYFATESARRSVQVALISNVTQAWLRWQADHAQLELSRDTLTAYEKTLKLTRGAFELGATSALDVRQAQTAVDSTRATIEGYSRAVMLDQNELTFLLGQPIPADIRPGRDFQHEQLVSFPVGIPSQLLLQRPDILQAEHQLKAANASIGAARSAFFPNVSLSASLGTAGGSISDLFKGGSGYWSFMPNITLPIFRAGELAGSLEYAKVSKNIQISNYEKTIQRAFREVNDGIAARITYLRQVNAQTDLVETSEDYFRLAEQRYRLGFDDYLTLLDAQRQLFSAQQQLIMDQLQQNLTEVTLFKALGGGWQDQEPLAVNQDLL